MKPHTLAKLNIISHDTCVYYKDINYSYTPHVHVGNVEQSVLVSMGKFIMCVNNVCSPPPQFLKSDLSIKM